MASSYWLHRPLSTRQRQIPPASFSMSALPKEYAEGHLAGAQQLDYLNPEAFDAGIRQLDKSRTYYIYCRSGKRSHGACLKMKKQGFKVYDMEGGILNWTKLGMPVER